VMEYLFGESLGECLDREGTLGRAVVLPALRQAASALAAAHAEGVVHRDVKPDNLFLVGEPGDPYDLKVLDFGLSKLQSSQHTAAGIVLGTPRYMAPEQALAEGVDARSDVYGLGMVLYRAFVGRCPFEDGDDMQTLGHQLHSPPTPPSLLVEGLDGGIEAVILTAIRKRPENRYPTMTALYEDLMRLEQGLAPEGARPVAGDLFEPRTKIGRFVAATLGRMIGVAVDD
jgi:serine/threonine protein kinase